MILLVALATAPLLGMQSLSPVKDGSEIKITGTSSLHDWEEEATSFDVTGDIQADKVANLQILIQTKSIKSGKSIMDDKTHEALKANKYPHITLKAESLVIKGTTISGQAQLQIAGKTKTISINSKLTDLGDNLVSVSGSLDIIMSEYGVDPPTAMFGTMVTGDKVNVQYLFKLKKN